MIHDPQSFRVLNFISKGRKSRLEFIHAFENVKSFYVRFLATYRYGEAVVKLLSAEKMEKYSGFHGIHSEKSRTYSK